MTPKQRSGASRREGKHTLFDRLAAHVRRWPLALLFACALGQAACTETVANPIRVASAAAGAGGDGASGGGAPDDAAMPQLDGGAPWSDSGSAGAGGDVPPTRHCADAANWPQGWAAAELELFNQLNALRMQRPRCGREQPWGEPQPLRLAPELRCSARLHSKDMVERGFAGTVNPEGLNPADRAAAAGFAFFLVYERIAVGGSDVTPLVQDLRESRDYCMILANPAFGAVGIGLYQRRWTLDFAGP